MVQVWMWDIRTSGCIHVFDQHDTHAGSSSRQSRQALHPGMPASLRLLLSSLLPCCLSTSSTLNLAVGSQQAPLCALLQHLSSVQAAQ